MSPDDQKDATKTTVELTANLSGLIDKLTKCSTTHYEDSSAYEGDEGTDLLLDYWVDDETRRAFRFHFGVGAGGSEELSRAASALNLFQSLQTLLTLNYYQVGEETKAELYRSDSLYVNEIAVTVTLKTKDVTKLQPTDIDLQLNAPGREEEVEGWKEVFGIEERYKAKFCAENDGRAWLQQIVEEAENGNVTSDQLLAMELRKAERFPYSDANFLKKPFLTACKSAKII